MRTSIRIVVALLALAASPAQAQRIDIAAIVGDEVITTADVAERRDLLMATNNLPPTMENMKRVTPRVVQSLIEENIQMQEARRLSISVSKEELSSAIGKVEASRRMEPDTLLKRLQEDGLSVRSMEAQLTAQLAWNKVVQRKLRREVSISADEIARAQQAAAADPGVPEIRMAAISILVPKPEDEARQAQLAKELSDKLQAGSSVGELSVALAGRSDVRISPPGWVAEEKLQPAMQQAMRSMQPGQVSPPLRSMNTIQLIQLLERRVAKKIPDTTEMLIKEIAMPAPANPDQKSMLALREAVELVRANPGDCESNSVGVPDSAARVKYARLNYGMLPEPVKPLLTDIGVTEVTQPMMADGSVRMFMLCERIDASLNNLPPADEVRRQLFNEKIELEAEKHLRNLKRDTFIEVKGMSVAPDASAPVPPVEEKAPAKATNG